MGKNVGIMQGRDSFFLLMGTAVICSGSVWFFRRKFSAGEVPQPAARSKA